MFPTVICLGTALLLYLDLLRVNWPIPADLTYNVLWVHPFCLQGGTSVAMR